MLKSKQGSSSNPAYGYKPESFFGFKRVRIFGFYAKKNDYGNEAKHRDGKQNDRYPVIFEKLSFVLYLL